MAKGDQSNSANGTGVPPKTDQYSVMHKIMDSFGSPNTSIAPSAPPPMPQQQSFMPNNDASIGGAQMGGRFNTNPIGSPADSMDGGNNFQRPNLPGMGSNWGITGGAFNSGSIAPSNPQDMIRRSMTNNRTFGQ